MKSTNLFLLIVGLLTLVIGIAWYIYPGRQQRPAQNYTATIQKDCAPWDGPAFTVAIPMDDGTIVSVSIWHSAEEIKSPLAFQFPDDSGQVGNASLMLQEGMPEELSGTVSFEHFNLESPVGGQFELAKADGQRLSGIFVAEWNEVNMLCG